MNIKDSGEMKSRTDLENVYRKKEEFILKNGINRKETGYGKKKYEKGD